MLGLMVGDALGAAVEGFPPNEIRNLARDRWGCDVVQGYVLAVPMGTFVPAGEPGKYRAATQVKDCNFVPTGPPRNEAVASQCARIGMYTDDTNAALALASSIVDRGSVDPSHAARRCAEFFRDNEAFRGCPPTAKMALQKVLDGVPVEEIGLPPHFPFEGGSFANGGAMRISPLGLAFRSVDAQAMRQAAARAVLASHRHPEAVDFAFVQALAVRHALAASPPSVFDPYALLQDAQGQCESEGMRAAVAATEAALRSYKASQDEWQILQDICKKIPRPGSGMGFQIASVHMAPCVLWVVCRHHQNPRDALQAAIALGGDTDTTASMVGAVVGALHGTEWCKDWAVDLENGAHGRDYALSLADQLVALDLKF